MGSPAVVLVPAKDDTRVPVDPDLLVEPFVPHVHVEVGTGLSKRPVSLLKRVNQVLRVVEASSAKGTATKKRA